MEKVSRELAIKEFETWAYEVKRIKPRLIEEDKDYKEFSESIIENIIDGTFSLDEAGNITQKLAFELGDGTDSITLKPRLTVGEMQKMSQAKKDNEMGKTIIILTLLTGINKGLISRMDMIDLMTSSPLTAMYMVG